MHADVTFDVPVVSITGLLGRNGAVKTTTMRVLAGLSRPDDGTAQLLGEPSRLAAGVLARVGVTIDGPGLRPAPEWPSQPGARVAGGQPALASPALKPSLELAGLGETLDRKVKGYSTGMRQRLMLAQAARCAST